MLHEISQIIHDSLMGNPSKERKHQQTHRYRQQTDATRGEGDGAGVVREGHPVVGQGHSSGRSSLPQTLPPGTGSPDRGLTSSGLVGHGRRHGGPRGEER